MRNDKPSSGHSQTSQFKLLGIPLHCEAFAIGNKNLKFTLTATPGRKKDAYGPQPFPQLKIFKNGVEVKNGVPRITWQGTLDIGVTGMLGSYFEYRADKNKPPGALTIKIFGDNENKNRNGFYVYSDDKKLNAFGLAPGTTLESSGAKGTCTPLTPPKKSNQKVNTK